MNLVKLLCVGFSSGNLKEIQGKRAEGHCHGSWASHTTGPFLVGHPTNVKVCFQYVPLGKTTQSRGSPVSNRNYLTDLTDNGTYKSFPLGIWDKSKAISSKISLLVYTMALNP